jgi:hypothetical protein
MPLGRVLFAAKAGARMARPISTAAQAFQVTGFRTKIGMFVDKLPAQQF